MQVGLFKGAAYLTDAGIHLRILSGYTASIFASQSDDGLAGTSPSPVPHLPVLWEGSGDKGHF